MSLWTSAELIDATGGDMQHRFDASGLSIDSRDIQEGDLFVALKAARDGHEFVKSAIENGAAGALVSHIPKGCENLPLLVVDNVEDALAKMAAHRRAAVQARIVAVTGSAGKTSTKEMLRTVLAQFGKTHASEKSFNNHWGVPLTLARMPKDAEFAVFEIGMNHPGEIAPLVAQVQPDIAIITNIAPVHLEGFGAVEGIAREKASILQGLDANGLGIVNGDVGFRDIIEGEKKPVAYFGAAKDCALKLDYLESNPESTNARANIFGTNIKFSLSLGGAHHAQNALAVLGVAARFGLDMNIATLALAGWQAPDGRGKIYETAGIVIVDESYNANPLSMRAALDGFVARKAKRYVAVLGDMRELGEQSPQFHADLAKLPAMEKIDLLYTVGEEMRALRAASEKPGEHFENSEALKAHITGTFQAGDAVLFKASNGIGLGRVVDAVRNMGQSQ